VRATPDVDTATLLEPTSSGEALEASSSWVVPAVLALGPLPSLSSLLPEEEEEEDDETARRGPRVTPPLLAFLFRAAEGSLGLPEDRGATVEAR
jgi:hypothetical protein